MDAGGEAGLLVLLLVGAYQAVEALPQLPALGDPQAEPEAAPCAGGRMLSEPSSRIQRPALEGLAKVEMKGPRDWKAAWRTWNQREQRGDRGVRQL